MYSEKLFKEGSFTYYSSKYTFMYIMYFLVYHTFQSELFQDDLYPDTPGDTPACTAAEFMAGAKSEPILVS
jgi:hypothetical protein